MEFDASLESLRERLHGPRPPMALVGAGVSVPMGYPTWSGLIDMLHKRLVEPSDALREKQGTGQLANSWYSVLKDFDKDPLWQAEAYEQALPPGDLAKFIKEHFGEKSLGEAHRRLGMLPFRHYLTTNFDPSIQQSLRKVRRLGGQFTWADKAKVSRFLLSLHTDGGRPQVVHLHGKYDRPKTLVLTEQAYVDRYVTSDDARRKLLAIFLTYPVVFVGFSMDDPDLSQIMREVAARLGKRRGAEHHYGIFGYRSLAEKEAIRRRMQDKFGVCVIFYEIENLGPDPDRPGRSREGHDKLNGVLEYLAHGERPPPDYAKKRREMNPKRDDADPQKGQWGGEEVSANFAVTVEKLDEEHGKWLEFALVVKRRDGKPFTENVVFHLHDTFAQSRVPMEVTGKAEARLKRWAYGAFTAGVELERSGERLEIDLAQQKDVFPAWFRNQ